MNNSTAMQMQLDHQSCSRSVCVDLVGEDENQAKKACDHYCEPATPAESRWKGKGKISRDSHVIACIDRGHTLLWHQQLQVIKASLTGTSFLMLHWLLKSQRSDVKMKCLKYIYIFFFFTTAANSDMIFALWLYFMLLNKVCPCFSFHG